MAKTRMMTMIAAVMLPSAGLATPAPVRRLSPAQVEQVLADAAVQREAAEDAAPRPKPAIHGEVGVEVGTGGARAAYGTAVVPLGEDGTAVVSVETAAARHPHRRRH